MTHRPKAAFDCRIVTRWCELAERRLEHLTDLRESGRWRRYYSEASFAADLRDAERAVAAWHRLVPRGAFRGADVVAIDRGIGLPVG